MHRIVRAFNLALVGCSDVEDGEEGLTSVGYANGLFGCLQDIAHFAKIVVLLGIVGSSTLVPEIGRVHFKFVREAGHTAHVFSPS